MKKNKLIVAFQPPLVPCCVGCDAVKDTGSVCNITLVLCVDDHIPPFRLAVLQKVSAQS